MNTSYGILSLLPPLVAVGLAIWKKQLLPALFLGILAGEAILARGNFFSALTRSLDDSITTLGDKANLQIVLFSILAGGLLKLINESLGFQGLINWLEKKNILREKKAVYPLTYLLNISLFIDSWSSIIITGFIMRSIYSRFGISRERLGYFLHTIGLNFVALVLLNSWGAYYLSLLRAQNVKNPLGIIVGSVPLNFYCLGSLGLVMIVMITEFTIGPMKKFEKMAKELSPQAVSLRQSETMKSGNGRRPPQPKATNLLLPVVMLIIFVFLGLYLSGKGNLLKGSGAASLFQAASITILVMIIFFLINGTFNFKESTEILFKGMSDLLPVGALLILAITMGSVCRQIGTGQYLADVVKHGLPAFLMPALAFGLSCVISFATGTCWGTLAIMVPIAMPIAASVGINPSLIFGACVGGGVFGNNCSPIADTSILTGLAAEINVIDHVKTQIPFALIVASVSFVFYAISGLIF